MILTPADFRGARLYVGIPATDAGTLIGVTENTVLNWERGNLPLFPDAAEKLQAYVDVFERAVDAIAARGGDVIPVYRTFRAFERFEPKWAPAIRFPSGWVAAATVAKFSMEPEPTLVYLKEEKYDAWRLSMPDTSNNQMLWLRSEFEQIKGRAGQ